MKTGKVSTSWGTTVSNTLKMLIDTTPTTNNSTLLKETFNDEYYRLSTNVNFESATVLKAAIGTWDSTKLLTSTNAQQYFGSLQIAQTNYGQYGVTVDYTGFANDTQVYYRSIVAEGKSNSNGTLKITTSNIIGVGKDIEVYIKFPTLTGWLDVTKLYDAQVFANNTKVDGTGCATAVRVTSSTVECDWTIGTNSTFNSGFMYSIKVVMKNKLAKINEIEEISSMWR